MQSQSLMQKLQDLVSQLVDKSFAVTWYTQEYQTVNTNAKTKYEMAKTVLDKLIPFYCKANIPLISEGKACQKIIKAVDENVKLRRIAKQRQEKPNCLARLRTEEIQLKKTFPLWPQNVVLLLKNSEDVKFLQSMKTDLIATFGSKDAVLVKKSNVKNAQQQ